MKPSPGLKINKFKKLFGQYADYMDLYCKTNQKNLDEVQSTLSAFCKISGCKINYDKTTVYCIGKDNKSIAKLYTKGMWVEPTCINILGVWISENPEQIIELNYEKVITTVQAKLNIWQQCSLDLLSKITIINTLVASLFVYKMCVLPSMPGSLVGQINKIMEEFLWNGRKAKIPLHKLQNSKWVGGAGLVDFRKKEQVLKSSWIPYIVKGE